MPAAPDTWEASRFGESETDICRLLPVSIHKKVCRGMSCRNVQQIQIITLIIDSYIQTMTDIEELFTIAVNVWVFQDAMYQMRCTQFSSCKYPTTFLKKGEPWEPIITL